MQRFAFLGTVLGAAGAALRPRTAFATTAPSPSARELRKLLDPRQKLVAFAVTDGATVIDFSGPWETFQDVGLPGADMSAYVNVLVGESLTPVVSSGGMQILPRYTFADDLQPHIVVVPAQAGGPALTAWLRERAPKAEVVMSVCTGAFRVAEAGLFDGKSATTHHDFYDSFAKKFPAVRLVRGPRFVDEGNVCSAGGLSSGIDLALHVVERTYGTEVSNATAYYMEFVRSARPVRGGSAS
jgi:transcriptional regulator GlxA family with amidase domain